MPVDRSPVLRHCEGSLWEHDEVYRVERVYGVSEHEGKRFDWAAVIGPVPWWPGRTDEVRRVADRLRALGQPDGETTNGELARRTGADAWIVADAVAMNECVADAVLNAS